MTKRLYRSSKDRVLLGVCGGVGEYFKVDPVLIRVVWVVSAFAGGAGILIYLIAAVIMPVKAEDYGVRTYQNQQAEPVSTDETMTESPVKEDTAEPASQSSTQDETDSNN